MPTDADYMRHALALAARGRGWVNPNPMVGAVIVREGAIVGEGWHERAGGPHAEVAALAAAGDRARDATLYVSLEPCSHRGRTPPCTDAILGAGVRRVVFACRDENPLTAGRGRPLLETGGLEVAEGVEEDAARELNAPFLKFARTGLPYVLCKTAMTLDGKIATATGQSRWISGEAARYRVQEWRATYAAIMVGIGTVLADDPRLTCRLPGAHRPARVVVDPEAATPPGSRLLEGEGRTLIAVGPGAPAAAAARLRARGAEIVACPGRPDPPPDASPLERLDLGALGRELAAREIASILAEGGGGLNAALLRQGLVDRVAFFVAPLLLGGRGSRLAVAGADLADLDAGVPLGPLRVERLGEDLLIEGDVRPHAQA